MTFRRSEAVALGGFLLAWKNSNLQVRRPSWNRPTFWSRSLTSQLARPVPAGTPMSNFLSISGLLNYVAVVDQLVMTIVGPMTGAGIRFEIDVNGSPVPALVTASRSCLMYSRSFAAKSFLTSGFDMHT